MSDAAARERALRKPVVTLPLKTKRERILHDALAAERERTRQLEEALLRKRDALRYVAWASFDTQSDAEICDLMRGVARAALDSAEASGA